MPDTTSPTPEGLEPEFLDSRLALLAEHGARSASPPGAEWIRARANREVRRRRVTIVGAIAMVACVLAVLVFGDAFVDQTIKGQQQQHMAHRGNGGVARTGQATTVGVGQMSLQMPAGWVLYRNGGSPFVGRTQSDCLERVGLVDRGYCDRGITLVWGRFIPGAEGSAYVKDQPSGWYTGTDVGECPIGRTSAGASVNGIDPGGRPVLDDALRPVGAHQADYTRWRATCADGSVFYPRAWFLPQSRILVKTILPVPEAARILHSAKFASDGAKVPPAYHKHHGTLESMTAKHAGVRYGGRTRTYALHPSTACLGGVVVGRPGADEPTACSAFATYLASAQARPVHVEVYLVRGRLVQIAES